MQSSNCKRRDLVYDQTEYNTPEVGVTTVNLTQTLRPQDRGVCHMNFIECCVFQLTRIEASQEVPRKVSCSRNEQHQLLSLYNFTSFFNSRLVYTVEPSKSGHFGEFAFVLCREVVFFSEVLSAECVLYVFYNSKRFKV